MGVSEGCVPRAGAKGSREMQGWVNAHVRSEAVAYFLKFSKHVSGYCKPGSALSAGDTAQAESLPPGDRRLRERRHSERPLHRSLRCRSRGQTCDQVWASARGVRRGAGTDKEGQRARRDVESSLGVPPRRWAEPAPRAALRAAYTDAWVSTLQTLSFSKSNTRANVKLPLLCALRVT